MSSYVVYKGVPVKESPYDYDFSLEHCGHVLLKVKFKNKIILRWMFSIFNTLYIWRMGRWAK